MIINRHTMCATNAFMPKTTHMKYAIFAFFLLLSAPLCAQLSFGIKGGMHNQLNQPEGSIVVSGSGTPLSISVDDLKIGYQFGAFFRLGNKVFLQPELMFNTNRTDFRITDINLNEVRSETYQYMDLPVLLGFSMGPFMFHGGPVGHYFINSKSELLEFQAYGQKFDTFTWGWLAGVGIGRKRFSIDLRYEGNFNQYGSHITLFGDPYNFSTNPSRLMVNVGIKLFGNRP